MLDIRLQVGRLEMFLRISADTDAEAAVAFALKGTDGSDQAIGVGVAVRIGREALYPVRESPPSIWLAATCRADA